jgi:hypothetical protein
MAGAGGAADELDRLSVGEEGQRGCGHLELALCTVLVGDDRLRPGAQAVRITLQLGRPRGGPQAGRPDRDSRQRHVWAVRCAGYESCSDVGIRTLELQERAVRWQRPELPGAGSLQHQLKVPIDSHESARLGLQSTGSSRTRRSENGSIVEGRRATLIECAHALETIRAVDEGVVER